MKLNNIVINKQENQRKQNEDKEKEEKKKHRKNKFSNNYRIEEEDDGQVEIGIFDQEPSSKYSEF